MGGAPSRPVEFQEFSSEEVRAWPDEVLSQFLREELGVNVEFGWPRSKMLTMLDRYSIGSA